MNIKELLKNPSVTLLDVRDEEEVKQEGSVMGAILIPMNEIPSKIEEIRQFTTPLIVFCRSGIRSEKVVEYLINHGLKDIYNGGGFKQINNLLES